MNGIYMKVKNEPIFIFDIEEKNKIKLFFEYGRRDEAKKGLAHIYEHMLITYLRSFYNDFIEEINGYVDIDLIQIEINITKEYVSSFINKLINEDFSQVLKYEYYENNLNLINQELVLHKSDFAEEIQNSIYSNFYFDEKMKTVLNITTHPSFEEVKNFELFIKTLNVILINSSESNLNIVNITNSIYHNQNFDKNKFNSNKLVTKNINLNNMVLLTRLALLNIKEFDIPDDIYYIRLISLIINKRLAILKDKSVYFEMCYTSFHRYELYFSIVISSNKTMKDTIFNELQKILSVEINNKEIEYIHEQNNFNNKEELYKEKLTVLYKSGEFLNKKYKKEINIRRINILLKYIVNEMNGFIEFY